MGELTDQARERKRIVISGAGPAGLLTASLLLNKNKEAGCTVTYDVTLIDGRQDYGSIPQKELSENHRSWMLGLADHGMDAIKTLPDLYENYVKDEVSLFCCCLFCISFVFVCCICNTTQYY